jgi:hypothetical protein
VTWERCESTSRLPCPETSTIERCQPLHTSSTDKLVAASLERSQLNRPRDDGRTPKRSRDVERRAARSPSWLTSTAARDESTLQPYSSRLHFHLATCLISEVASRIACTTEGGHGSDRWTTVKSLECTVGIEHIDSTRTRQGSKRTNDRKAEARKACLRCAHDGFGKIRNFDSAFTSRTFQGEIAH